MKHVHRRAFSLIDLVGALAFVSLGTAVMLPLLHSSRNASQGDTSRARLKTLIRAHAAYSIGHQDRWLNPFNPSTSAGPNWCNVAVPGSPGFSWVYNDSGYQTEMYAMHWASSARAEMLGGNAFSPAQFDPRDADMITRFQTMANTIPAGQLSGWAWAGSYLYSPTMWFNAARYAGATRPAPTAPNQLNGTRSVRYNTTAETTYPSQKVVLFQRADFDQTSRPGANGLSPQWNNAVASPDAAFADGSVEEVSIRKVQTAINAGAGHLTPTTPSWNIPTPLLVNYDLGSSWENGQNNTTAWPAFFWGTRGGVGGRDVPQR